MLRLSCAVTLAVTSLACSQGAQTLYLASDRPEECSVQINGKQQEMPLRTFQAYGRVKLTKGAEIVIESHGAKVDHLDLPPVEEGDAAIVFVGGAPSFKLVDYKGLAAVGQGSNNSQHLALAGISRTDIEVTPIDSVKKYVVFDQRAAVAGPDAPMPAGGQVNQFSFAKFPIYRIERVPPGADVFETIKPRVDTELGFRKLPGSPP